MALFRSLRLIASKPGATNATNDMGLEALEDISFTQQHDVETYEWQKETESIADQLRKNPENSNGRDSGDSIVTMADDTDHDGDNIRSIVQRFDSLGYYALDPDEKLLLDSIQVYSAMNGSIKHLSTTTNPLAPLSPQRLADSNNANNNTEMVIESTLEKDKSRESYIDVDMLQDLPQPPQAPQDKENLALAQTKNRPKTSRGIRSPLPITTSSSSSSILVFQSDPTVGIGSSRSVIKPGVGHPAIAGRGLRFQKEGVRAGGINGQTKIRFV